jgi:N utilization substance protein B
MYEQETSYRVVLNEAIELAKEYGGPESASFINGVLASYLNNADGVVEE